MAWFGFNAETQSRKVRRVCFGVGSRCERDGEQTTNDVVWVFNTEAQRLGGTEVVLELARGASALGNRRRMAWFSF